MQQCLDALHLKWLAGPCQRRPCGAHRAASAQANWMHALCSKHAKLQPELSIQRAYRAPLTASQLSMQRLSGCMPGRGGCVIHILSSDCPARSYKGVTDGAGCRCTNVAIIPELHQQHHVCMQVSSRRSGKRTTTPVPRSPTSCQTRDSLDSSWCDTKTACSLNHAAMIRTAHPPNSSWCKLDVTQPLCLAVHMSGRRSLCLLTQLPPCI